LWKLTFNLDIDSKISKIPYKEDILSSVASLKTMISSENWR
jgi:hypothetical protein